MYLLALFALLLLLVFLVVVDRSYRRVMGDYGWGGVVGAFLLSPWLGKLWWWLIERNSQFVERVQGVLVEIPVRVTLSLGGMFIALLLGIHCGDALWKVCLGRLRGRASGKFQTEQERTREIAERLARIAEYKELFRSQTTEALTTRVNQGALTEEAEAAQEVLRDREELRVKGQGPNSEAQSHAQKHKDFPL